MLNMLSAEVGVPLVSKVVESVDNIEWNCWMTRRQKRRLPGFTTQENADTFPNLICRDSRYGQTGPTCCERDGPTACSISFLVSFIEYFGFHRTILKCGNEQDAVIHAFVEVEVVPQDPLEGDHGQRSCGDGCAKSDTTMQNTSDFN